LEASPTLVRERPVSVAAESAADGAALLYERYYDRVFGYCLYQLGSREEAEDVAQTTFMWAFRGLRRGIVPRAEASWLFTIAQNACRARHRSRGRKRAREVLSDPVQLADMSPAHAADTDDLMGLEDALARMPDQQRRAILLREWRGLSYKEIAAEMELSNAAVETLIFRARRSLADLLSGKPAPKRAGRFAFFPGAIAAACKGLMGSGTVAKLTAGLAAALVATTVAGSTEVPRSAASKRTFSTPVVAPHQLAQHQLAQHQLAQHPTKAEAARHHAPPKRHSKSRPSTPSEKPQAPTSPLKAVEEPVKTVNETGAQARETVRNVIAPVTDTLPALGVELP
jgi:RNA polymerase sigma-70 factor (ECF subfamily)